MPVRCHLDAARICDSSCICFDQRAGCRIKPGGPSITAGDAPKAVDDDLGLKGL